MKTRTLYHFTCLFHLANIVAEGLTRGMLGDTTRKSGVISFTKRSEPTEALWGGDQRGIVDKLKIRITAVVPDGPHLMRWFDALRKLGTHKPHQYNYARRLLDPSGDGHNWFCYFGKIPPSALLYEIRNGNRYEPLAGETLAKLVAKIKDERKKWDFWKGKDGCSYMNLREEYDDSFLIDNPKYRNLYLLQRSCERFARVA